MKHLRELFSWQDNAFLDLWSIVHIFWGGILGLICIRKKFPFYPSLFVSTCILILWEYVEYLWGVSESWTNITTDILLGMAGFILGYTLPKKFNTDSMVFFVPVVIAASVLTYIGWINYLTQ